MALQGNSNEEKIWNYLCATLGNAYGAAGLMGNLYAESALDPKNLQNSGNTKLKLTDAEYTTMVDNGIYSNFANDGYGYGLAQWTYKTRKLNLLSYARQQKASIGDLETQLAFLMKELESYSSVLKVLKSASSVKEASDVVLLKFEKPADQSVSVQTKRASYGQKYYDKYNKGEEKTMADYSKYIYSTGTHYISNSGGDERGKITGGSAGDQTGKEWQLKAWYNRPWTHVFRYEKDPRVGMKLAELGCAAALNDKIGYDQNQRTTYWTQLKKVGYDPSKITVACEEDCSAGVAANVKACGYILGITALQNVSSSSSSRNTKSQLKNAGFTVLTDSKYRTSGNYLLPGDILLYENHHVAMNITKGAKATMPTAVSTPTTPGVPTNPNTIGFATANGSMNIRTSPKANATSLGTVSKGTKLEVLEVTSDNWYKVLYKNVYGYTSNSTSKYYTYEEYKKPEPAPETSTPSASNPNVVGLATANASMWIRTEPKAGATTLGTIAKGTKLEVLEVTPDNWYKVVYNKNGYQYGYTSNSTGKYYDYQEYKKVEADPSYVRRASQKPEGTKTDYVGSFRTTGQVNVRDGAGTVNKALVIAPRNTVVTCDGSYTETSGVVWLYVSFIYKSLKYYGFCSSKYLTKV